MSMEAGENRFEPFGHVVIVGTGLLGASLGLALKARGLTGVVTGVGRSGSASLDVAVKRGAIDHAMTDLASAATGAHVRKSVDLVVLCTPIRQFPEALRILAPALQAGTLVTDVGSTKGEVLRWARELLPPHVEFVGSHPMAGSEKSGPEAARADLYANAVCLMCAAGDGRKGFARIQQMWEQLGMRTIELSPDVHDRWVATVSHLPHAVAFALVNAAGKHPEMLEAAAGGFLDTTRVASSDLSMWTDIFMTNREAVLAAVDDFAGELDRLRSAIDAGDEKAIRAILAHGKQVRDELAARRKTAGRESPGTGRAGA
jgi:prephenate dehydrogenase